MNRTNIDSVFKWLGIVWSVFAFLAVAVFFLGGEWGEWQKVKARVALLDGDLSGVVTVSELNSVLASLGTGKRSETPGGNAVSEVCPEGSYMIGLRFKVDSGGPHGIVSNLFPICREIVRK